jgi:hypothetical protein
MPVYFVLCFINERDKLKDFRAIKNRGEKGLLHRGRRYIEFTLEEPSPDLQHDFVIILQMIHQFRYK